MYRVPLSWCAPTAVHRFWESRDSADYVDWRKVSEVVLLRLKPSTTTISIRLRDALLERIRVSANKRDVPYQLLIKIWLAEKLESET